MLETMYVRCTHCGYDNSPEYRFCGMCGASLAHPPVADKPAVRELPSTPRGQDSKSEEKSAPVETVHGPSFLGLADDPKSEFHYLYEDEQPSSHIGLIVIVLLLIGLGGASYWQWKHNGYPFNRLNATAPATQPSPSTNEPAQAQNQPAPPAQPPEAAAPSPTDQSPAAQSSTNTPDQNQSAGASADNSSATNSAGPEKSTSSAEDQPPATDKKPTEIAKATPPEATPSAHAKSSKKIPAPKPKKSQPAPEPTAAAKTPVAPDADLEAAGERYLYGTGGIAQNCSRAQSNLNTAAMHGNAKAQAVLGTMYYTGHCVARDLPTAYRWFARALRRDPQNSTLSADLQVLWRQMSADERQLAIKAQE